MVCGLYPSRRKRSTSFDLPTAESPSKIIFTVFFPGISEGSSVALPLAEAKPAHLAVRR